MNPFVDRQVGGVSEGLLALRTHVRLRVLVLLHVDPQTSSVGKTFLASRTLVGFVAGVNMLMFLQ